jgi:hypothetical protein
MKISESFRSLSRRQLPTAEEVDARREANSVRERIREDEAALRNELNAQFRGPR